MDYNLSNSLETVFLPLGAIFLIFGLPVLAFVFFRVLAHRERMAMIASGQAIGNARKPNSGVPPVAGNVAFDRSQLTEAPELTLNKGIRLSLIGLALTIGLSIMTFHMSENGASWYPGPWLLVGLVPMFIGVAQTIIAILSGAQIGARPIAPPPVVSNDTAPYPTVTPSSTFSPPVTTPNDH